jgi:hypothetical protein
VSDITSRNSAPEAWTALQMAFDVSPSTVETSTYLHPYEPGVLSIYKDVTAHVVMPKLDELYFCSTQTCHLIILPSEHIIAIGGCIQPSKKKFK